MLGEQIYTHSKLLEGESLRPGCLYAHVVQGYAESQRRVWCTYGRWDRPEPMGFAVKECTEFLGRAQTSLRQMVRGFSALCPGGAGAWIVAV